LSEIILHHYDTSPYSEKIRAILGYKQLPWRSVLTPMIMPKPDLVALTGGYRKAPVMQIGADVYCDTSLIARVLDRLYPEPPVAPSQHRASCTAFSALDQLLFYATVPVIFQPAGLKALDMTGDTLAAFSKDREALFSGGSARRPNQEFSKTHFLPLFATVDAQLEATPFLLGEAPTLADFCVYHSAWFVLSNPGVADALSAFRRLRAWFERIKALGHGRPSLLDAAAALDQARTATARLPHDGPLLESEKCRPGERVTVAATDYGCDPVTGTLLHASVFEIVVQRRDERAGEVAVHFPRSGFRMAPAS
jgi:glutathione S-transferase